MIATDADILLHTLRALEPNPNRVRVTTERNPVEYCFNCGARDYFGTFTVELHNGREIGLCDDCK